MSIDSLILNCERPPIGDADYTQVKAVLRLCDVIVIKWAQTDRRFWQVFGVTLYERDEALSMLADLEKKEKDHASKTQPH